MNTILLGKLLAGVLEIASVSVGSIFLSRHLNGDVGTYAEAVVEVVVFGTDIS